jgi:geranyl-CoA carboxylase alpha subunit
MALRKLLIANRGEIAARIIRTARRLGYRTVAIYSDADRSAVHVAAADEAVRVGAAPVAESYLSIERVLEAAAHSAADAVHPGYGFLSENSDFARACADAGLTFVGPPVAAIELMGNKRAAKLAMLEAGVPCVPGYQGADQGNDTLITEAAKIGFPVMVKAAAGGGGRGMRLVAEADQLGEALRSARSEAESAFGSGELILEKAVVEPRHVEIQVFGDAQGSVVHLGERDCSVQRRHQKVIEECPSPAVDEALREKMGAAAVAAAKACAYVGAGTVEFLLDQDGSFYFLEMNTRLQVEHPVTEMVTGVDLVEWQLRVADGQALPLQQDAIEMRGHASAARLYAEDPSRGFLPQTGQLEVWAPAEGGEVRVDSGVQTGDLVSPHYDPMLAKLICHGATREDARRKLVSALRDTTVMGVVTNKAFLAAVCTHASFADGRATTAFITQDFAEHPSLRVVTPAAEAVATAALLVMAQTGKHSCEDLGFLGWRSGGPVWSTVKLAHGDDAFDARLLAMAPAEQGGDARCYQVTLADDESEQPPQVELELLELGEGSAVVVRDGLRRRVRYHIGGEAVWLDDGERVYRFADTTHQPAMSADEAGSGRLLAPLDGKVMELFVAAGEQVERGKLLLVLEAMKMEHPIRADVDGRVDTLHVAKGDQVKTRQLLVGLSQPEGAQEAD